MEKNIDVLKVPKGSFEEQRKEPFVEKLKSLRNGRTVKQCSDDWGVKLSTLKNYFARPDSQPRFDVLSKISNHEGVSIEWLMGNEDSFEPSVGHCSDRVWLQRLTEMLSMLEEEELEALAKQLTMKGLETILYLLDEDNIRLLRLDTVVKEKILGKHSVKNTAEANAIDKEARERVGSGTAGHERTPNLKQDKKQAV